MESSPIFVPVPCYVEVRTFKEPATGNVILWRSPVSGECPAGFAQFVIQTALQLADDNGDVFHAHQFEIVIPAADLGDAFRLFASTLKAGIDAETKKVLGDLRAEQSRIALPTRRRTAPGSNGNGAGAPPFKG